MGKVKAFFQDLLDKHQNDYDVARAEFEGLTQKHEELIDEVIDAQIEDSGWDVDVDEQGPFIVSTDPRGQTDKS